MVEKSDFVICPICKKRLKEINTAHLRTHNMDVKKFTELYPEYDRLSKECRIKKATLKNLTPEISRNLRFSHTLEGFKKKHGDELGIKRYKEMIVRTKRAKTIEFFIEKHGEIEGKKIFSDINKRKAVSLNNLIKKYGIKEDNKRYNNWKYSGRLENFIKRHGKEEGIKRWVEKNEKVSKKNRKIPSDKITEYKIYTQLVRRITNLSLKLFDLQNINLRGRKKGQYQLDHKVSIYYGFTHVIEPYIIGSIHNLEMIPTSVNCSKQHSCSLSINELIKSVEDDKTYLNLKEYYKECKYFQLRDLKK